MIVTVIGAGGHVGLPFSLVVAEAGHKVYGIDINREIVKLLNSGNIPYIEHGAEELLRKHNNTNIIFTSSTETIKDSDVVAIMLGTPVDEENNPRLDDLFSFVDNTLIPYIKKGTLVILRSTVSPGTTEVLRDRIEGATGWKEGEDFFLVFCPERVLQTKGIEETANLPQLIGAFEVTSFSKALLFFTSFVKNDFLRLTPREAEVAKLMTNMWRYVSFAFANEMYMIGDYHGVNVKRVIQAANHGYARASIPLPGPNVGGPCLFKDGRFLLDSVPFADLIQVSFLINEGMPDYIYQSIKKLEPKLKTVLILGAAFKAECDDTRNSLSYKMRKVLEKHGIDVEIYDPFVHEHTLPLSGNRFDAVILMTPHSLFKDYLAVSTLKKDCVIADVWKHFPESADTTNGIYRLGETK